MPYIEKEVLDRVKEVDVQTYLTSCRPGDIVKIKDGYYKGKIHDSLKIDHGMFTWWSHGISGRSAVDYLIKVENYSFMEAVQEIVNQEGISKVSSQDSRINLPTENKVLELPEFSTDYERVVEYLYGRGISKEVTRYFIGQKLIYQEAEHSNAAFIGRDYEGNIKMVTLRGTQGRFHSNASGSDRRYPFMHIPEPERGTLHIYEAPIDLLSYAEYLNIKGYDYTKANLLALCGINGYRKEKGEDKLPVALNHYLNHYPETEKIMIHFDNDEAGINAANSIKRLLPDKSQIINLPDGVKDVNDFIVKMKHALASVCKEAISNESEKTNSKEI